MKDESLRDLVLAIPKRHSVRKYTGKDIPPHLLHSLLSPQDIKYLGLSECRVEMIHDPGQIDEVFSGLVGGYGRIRGASAFIAILIPDNSGIKGLLEAGYVGEQYVLRATSLGLATCWVGATFKFKTLMGRLSVGPGEKVAAVIAVGWAADQADRVGGILHRFIKRKSLEAIADTALLSSEAWVREAAEAVRVAPSAMHLQPWYLRGDASKVVLAPTRQGGFTYMDLGIAALHFELVALHMGHLGQWHFEHEFFFS